MKVRSRGNKRRGGGGQGGLEGVRGWGVAYLMSPKIYIFHPNYISTQTGMGNVLFFLFLSFFFSFILPFFLSNNYNHTPCLHFKVNPLQIWNRGILGQYTQVSFLFFISGKLFGCLRGQRRNNKNVKFYRAIPLY